MPGCDAAGEFSRNRRKSLKKDRQKRLSGIVKAGLTAAGCKPLITSHVGGFPEIFGPLSARLVPPDDAPALAQAIAAALDNPAATIETARKLRDQVAVSFSVETMVDGVLAGYQAAIEALQASGRR
jgi:glycosyltransferase involved in cell wall biosynthesis